MGTARIRRCHRPQQLTSRRDEDPICAGGGGKGCKHFPWENNPNTPPPPPQLFPGPRFLSKPAFSVLLHNTRFCSIHSSSPCQQVLLGSRNMDFCGNGHFTQSAKRYWKVKLGVVWRAVGEMGRCVQVSGLPCPACSISPSPECPRDREQSPQAKFTVGSS